MNRRLDKQSLLGILLAVAILGVAGWLLFTRNNGDPGDQKIGQFGDNTVSSVLRPELDATLQNKPFGSVIDTAGSGKLRNGLAWAFKQTSPSPEIKVVNANGEEISSKDLPSGTGGTLTITGVSKIQAAQDGLRQSLADSQVSLAQQGSKLVMSSKQIVGGVPTLTGTTLQINGLFLRSNCKSQSGPGEVVLKESCSVTLGN
jgi:hypothetical protein